MSPESSDCCSPSLSNAEFGAQPPSPENPASSRLSVPPSLANDRGIRIVTWNCHTLFGAVSGDHDTQ
eukprot:819645-Pyramimonas_sp.AAC.1